MTEQKLLKYWLTISATLILSVFSIHSAKAQNSYRGKYVLTDILSGDAQFGYYVQKGDTVFNGPFRFQSELSENDDGQLEGVEFSGNYEDGKKSGNWIFRHKSVVPGDAAIFEGLQMVQKISGKEVIVSGDFVEGTFHGTWQITHRLIENSAAADTLFFTSAQFSNGTITGSIQGYSNFSEFTGNFDDSGRLHGSWKIAHLLKDNVELLEFRNYEHGVFNAHYFELLGEQFQVSYSGLDQSMEANETWVDVPLREESLNHLIYIIKDLDETENISIPDELEIDHVKVLISETNELLSHALSAFNIHDEANIWQHPDNSEVANTGMLRMREFKLNAEQSKKLKEAQNKIRDTERIISNFFEDPQIDIGKHSYRELNYFSGVFEVYFKNLRKLSNTIEIIADPSFKYVDLTAAFDVLKPKLEFPDSVAFQFKDQDISESYTIPEVTNDQKPIPFLHAHVSQIHREVIAVEEKVGKIVAKYKKQSQLTENEEKLVQKRDSIVDLFRGDLAPQRYNEYHEQLSEIVTERVNRWFEEYAELALESKLVRLDELLECFDEFLKLYQQVVRIPLRISDINDIYTRTVWNPYTYTDMDERVKERLYRAYENIILPTIWDDLLLSIECGKIADKGKNYERIYQKMLSLREQDTKEIEREIRRSNSFGEISKILSLSLNLDSVQE